MGSIGTLAQAEAFLEGLINMEREPRATYTRFGLEPVRRLLARVGNPEQGLEVVHIAGSKGKGSTALLLEAVLQAAGDRVGTFTSPHLVRWTERFRVDGREVDGERLVAAVDRLRPHVEALRAGSPEEAPTFFDVTTAAALLIFAEADLDRVVLEVGLGGRLDSTNVVRPRVCCVTSIELEHTDTLGTDHAAIASEKAGIIKPGVPVVIGVLPQAAMRVVETRAREMGSPCACLGRDFQVEVEAREPGGLRVRLRDGPLDQRAQMALCGDHQAANAALAVACARRFGDWDAEILGRAVVVGLAAARLPGRAEILSRTPWIVVDGAHTEASARALAAVLDQIPRRRAHLVLSVSAGKNLGAILEALLPRFQRVTLTRAEPVRSLDPHQVAAVAGQLAPEGEFRVIPDPHLALGAVRAETDRDGLLCAAGSVYLAGIARQILADGGTAAPGAGSERLVDEWTATGPRADYGPR